MKKAFLLLCSASLFLWFPFAYKRWSHPFRITKCLIEWPYNPDWDIPGEPPREIGALFAEPFTYLAKGKQSYVFLSSDGKHVLKLFRFDRCKTPFGQAFVHWARGRLGLRPKAPRKEFSERALRTFQSSWLCFEKAQLQTGVEWVHLNPEAGKIPPFQIKDRLGRTFRIDPSRIRLVVQKRAEPLLESMKDPARQDEIACSFYSLIDQLAALGFSNDDRKVGQNFGILEGRVVALDIGNFAQVESVSEEETAVFKERMRQWLSKH